MKNRANSICLATLLKPALMAVGLAISLVPMAGRASDSRLDSRPNPQLDSQSVQVSEFGTFGVPTIGLSVGTSQITLQNNTGVTCAHSPVSALRFDLGPLKLVWQSTAALQSGAIVIAFENENLKAKQYICEIDGTEFDAAFGTSGASVASTITSVSGCNIQCGGIEVNAGAPAFSAAGTISIFGTTQLNGSSRVQQRATIPITFRYQP